MSHKSRSRPYKAKAGLTRRQKVLLILLVLVCLVCLVFFDVPRKLPWQRLYHQQ